MWNTGIIPTDWRRGVVVSIWKGKFDNQECNIYRGLPFSLCQPSCRHEISLIGCAKKLLTHQRNERPHRDLRDIRIGLLAAYVDVRKAFDSVNRDVLWRTPALRGIPPKLDNLICDLYSGTVGAVMCDGTISEYFLVNTGVH